MISRRLLASGVGAALLAGAAATSTAAAAKAAAPPPRAAPLHLFAPGARPASSGFRRARPASVSIQPLRVTPRPLGSATSLRATSASPAPRQPSSISATPSAPTLITSFAGTSEDDAIGRFHTDQVLAPPDTNISVGTSDVIDVNNSSLYFYTRAGAFEAAFDINAFTGLPCHADSVTDPRVVFDSASGRFYFSVSVYVQSTGSGCVVLLASPASNVTTGTWVGYALQNADTTNCSPCFFDQPRLGYSDSIVAVAANEFVGNTANSPGGEIWIVQKSDLIAGSSNPNSQTVFADGPFSAQPVQTFGSSGGNQYVIWNDSYNGTGRVGVRDFTGQPESGNVSAGSAQYAAMQLTSGAVMPAAQSGTAAELNTDDDRLLDGVWQNGTIWTEGGTNCTTSTVANACINLLSIAANTSGTVASPANQLVYGISGDALYYPSIGVDSSGNAIAVWDQSSASADESIMVAGLSCGSGTCSLGAASTLHASSTYYDPGPGICSPGSPAVCRWGDYSGAAQDPAHPSDIWVAAEDSDSTTANCSSNECWSTYIGRYTYSKPSISSISPPTGPPTLSRTVTVNGSDFLPGTTATFGGNPVTVSGLTPDSFQFTVPTHSGPGALHTQASGTNGTSSLTTSDRYIYGVGFSNDARGDLAAVNSNSEWLKTASGNSFVGPSPWQNNTPFYGGVATLAGDVNGDGLTDLVAVNTTSVWVETSSGSGFTAPALWQSNTPFYGSVATLLADVNGDGSDDLVAIDSDSVWVMLSDGTAHFGPPQLWSMNTPFYGNVTTLAGDVTGLGPASLVAVNNNSTFVMQSTGHSFLPPTAWSSTPFYGSKATLIGDINGDGTDDLVAVNNNNSFDMTSTGHSFNPPVGYLSGALYGNRATTLVRVAGVGSGGTIEAIVAVNDTSIWVGYPAQSPAQVAEWGSGAFYGSIGTLSGG